jgi:hypothetical protein
MSELARWNHAIVRRDGAAAVAARLTEEP